MKFIYVECFDSVEGLEGENEGDEGRREEGPGKGSGRFFPSVRVEEHAMVNPLMRKRQRRD